MARPTVFIDGEAGTTGLQIRDRLEGRLDIELLSIDPEKRKDEGERAELLNEADVAILCLPDEAAREAVTLVTNPDTVIIDASSAHRTHPDWTYGFPEMTRVQRRLIKDSKRISNPGCYPTGFIALVRPLVLAELLPVDFPVTVNAVSGYSGGGRKMIEEFEASGPPYRAYALGQTHKHPPEMVCHTGLTNWPVFTPAVGNFAQGMLVEVPLAVPPLQGPNRLSILEDALRAAYPHSVNEAGFIKIIAGFDVAEINSIEPEACNGTNRLELFVFGTDEQARLIARLDNLGKGASGAAVQNLNLVLGVDEATGLKA
ncbi:MAG: N-acetyl-gamma-glutamyl-phosphate reductase [Pseudomonadota bacterium]